VNYLALRDSQAQGEEMRLNVSRLPVIDEQSANQQALGSMDECKTAVVGSHDITKQCDLCPSLALPEVKGYAVAGAIAPGFLNMKNISGKH
jgi:hypothetical protein